MSSLEEIYLGVFPWWKRIYYKVFGSPKFEPQIVVNKELGLMTFLFEDVPYVAKAIGKPHFVDELVSFDGRLVGVQVWAILPLDRTVKPTTTVGPSYNNYIAWPREQLELRISHLRDKLEDGGRTESMVKQWAEELDTLQHILDKRTLPW